MRFKNEKTLADYIDNRVVFTKQEIQEIHKIP